MKTVSASRHLLWPCAVIIMLMLQGCGLFKDSSLMETEAEDRQLADGIEAALLREDFSGPLAVSVFCYYGHVYLLGEIPAKLQAKAIAAARSFQPRSVTPHWFRPAQSEKSDLALASELQTALAGARDLSAGRIDAVVNDGRAVLLGVVHDEAEKRLAIKTAREVQGISSVTSYLMLPQAVGPD